MSVLKGLRESLGYSVHEVATQARWSTDSLVRLERTDDLDEQEAEILSDLYGVDVGRALSSGQRQVKSPVGTLLRAQRDHLCASTRFVISGALSVAREVRQLLQLVPGASVSATVPLSSFKENLDYRHPDQGGPEQLAELVRTRLKLGMGPVQSVSAVLAGLDVLVLYASMDPDVDAFSASSQETGGIVVVNPMGSFSRSASGRRLSLAHELCHLLFDRKAMRSMRTYCSSGRNEEEDHVSGESRRADSYMLERRARAFAVSFLAPVRALREEWARLGSRPVSEKVRHLMDLYGVGFLAMRAHLQNNQIISRSERLDGLSSELSPAWTESDPVNLREEPVFGVIPELRQGILLNLVAEGLRAGVLSESAAREYLRVPIGRWDEISPRLQVECFAAAARTWRTSSALLGHLGTEA